jgi:hypothetical protein
MSGRHLFRNQSIQLPLHQILILILQDELSVEEVTKEAFEVLGANGIIQVSDGHSCSECIQEYKATADIISDPNPTAMDGSDSESSSVSDDEQMQIDKAFVKLVVLDGIVTGPLVSIISLIFEIGA